MCDGLSGATINWRSKYLYIHANRSEWRHLPSRCDSTTLSPIAVVQRRLRLCLVQEEIPWLLPAKSNLETFLVKNRRYWSVPLIFSLWILHWQLLLPVVLLEQVVKHHSSDFRLHLPTFTPCYVCDNEYTKL